MIPSKTPIFIVTTAFILTEFNQIVNTLTVKDILKPHASLDDSENDLLLLRVPRDVIKEHLKNSQKETELNKDTDSEKETVVRKTRDSNNFPSNQQKPRRFRQEDRADRSLKPEDNNSEDGRGTKGSTVLGKRCTTCESGYLRPSSSGYDRSPDRYGSYNDRDPYYSGRSRYDPYDRYDRDRYYDRYDDYYDRDSSRDYRGRNRYTSSSYYDRYDPRDRYYDRGLGYENRGGGSDYRDREYYSPYNRDRYDTYTPYDDYYPSRGSGYDSYGGRGGYGRPDSSSSSGGGSYGSSSGGSYARGYSYGDRDRYGGYGSDSSRYGSYGNDYSPDYGTNCGVSCSSRYGSSYGGTRSRYPSYEYDSGTRFTSYLYGRPSSTTLEPPKDTDGDQGNTASPSSGRS